MINLVYGPNRTKPNSKIRHEKRPRDGQASFVDPLCQVYRVEIHAGLYHYAQTLVEELNYALTEALVAIFRVQNVPVNRKEEMNEILFVYSPTYNRVILEFSGPNIGDKHL